MKRIISPVINENLQFETKKPDINMTGFCVVNLITDKLLAKYPFDGEEEQDR